MRVLLFAIVWALTLGLASGCGAQATAQSSVENVVYEIPTRTSASVVLKAVGEHLDKSQAPLAIAVVAYGGGVEALLVGATGPNGDLHVAAISRLSKRGVDFAVCGATLKALGIDPERVVPQGRIVPSGTGEIERLVRAGYRRLN